MSGTAAVAKPETDPLLIAIDADFSTVAVEGGDAIAKGVALAVAQVNREGGLLGRHLQVVHKDHRGNPARGVANIRSLAQLDNLLAVVGGIHTPVAIAELPAIHQHNLLYLGAWAAGTAVVENNFDPGNVFRVSIRDSEAATVLVKHAKARGFKRVALALERTGWGRSNLDSITQAAQRHNISIEKVTWINWQQKSFEEAAASIESARVDAVIMVANAPEGAVITNAIYQTFGASLPIIAHWGIASGNFVTSVATDILQQMDIGVIQTFSFLYQNNPAAARLYKDYQSAYGKTAPDGIPAVVGLAHAYDLVQLLALAVKQANSVKVADIRQAMENLPETQGVVKLYNPAFTSTRHDALWAEDYFMARFNDNGNLIPMMR
ncbi:ABC transporter substrate-binding protein [Salinimonas marina]|nr:ABC transporter substrate-binding protein [Salinimonas marina]